jgi:ABC-type nitrate/sulfonate/bicarbonate transport system substrate-binding protein
MPFSQSHRSGKRAFLVVPAIALSMIAALTSCSSPSTSASSSAAADTSALTMPGPSGPLETHTITVEAVPTADEAGLYIAQDLGYFAQEGLTVNIEPTGGGELAIPDLKDGKADLAKGTIAAAWLPEPFGTIAQQTLGAVKIADFDSASLTNFPIGTYIGTQAWVSSHPNTVAAFLHALQEGQQKADIDRSQVEASLVTHTLVPNGTSVADSKQIAALMTLDTYPLSMDVPTIQRVSNAMFEFGLEPGLKQPYNILNMIQPEPGMIG